MATQPLKTYPDALDRVTCDGCSRSVLTFDGKALLAAIKGPCPDCGGRFELEQPQVSQAPSASRTSPTDLQVPPPS